VRSPAVRTRRWTRREYERLVEADILGPDDKIELLEGRLVVREPQHSPHATATRLVQEALRVAFGPGWDVALDPVRRRWEYRTARSLGPGESISPLAAPHASIAVADLLP
jgi:hypothetical protein